MATKFDILSFYSADLSFMSPAMIWALLWKHGGLLLAPNTILVSGLKTYYNFIVLNATFNGGSLALTQFTERHHELPSKIYAENNITIHEISTFDFQMCQISILLWLSAYIGQRNVNFLMII